MTNETGIERVFYIYNSSGCSCLWPYFHPPLLYTELCEVLWVPKLHRFPNKAGLCPGGTSWGLFRSSIGPTQRERPWALWFWQLILKLVLEAMSGQWHAGLAPGWGSMLCLQHSPSGIAAHSPQWLHRAALAVALTYSTDTPQAPGKSKPDRITGPSKSKGGKPLKFYPELPQDHGVFSDAGPLQTSSGWQRKRLYQVSKCSKIRKKLDYIQMRVGWHPSPRLMQSYPIFWTETLCSSKTPARNLRFCHCRGASRCIFNWCQVPEGHKVFFNYQLLYVLHINKCLSKNQRENRYRLFFKIQNILLVVGIRV